jgi:hypothetical protein
MEPMLMAPALKRLEKPFSPDPEMRRRALFGSTVFLIVHLMFTSGQILSTLATNLYDVVDHVYWIVSIKVNLLTDITTVAFLITVKLRKDWRTAAWFYPALVAMISVIIGTFLVHMHLAGTLTSPAALLFVAGWLTTAWFMRKRHAWMVFGIGNIAIFSLVMLEYFGYLPYAPIIEHNNQFAFYAGSWKVILSTIGIYLSTIIVIAITFQHFRSSVDHANHDLREANLQLAQEIEQRILIENEKQRLIEELETAFADLKTLSGLLPICSGCGQVRDDAGYWSRLEQYLHTHAKVKFTHGLCPNCLQDLYPEYADRITNEPSIVKNKTGDETKS